LCEKFNVLKRETFKQMHTFVLDLIH